MPGSSRIPVSLRHASSISISQHNRRLVIQSLETIRNIVFILFLWRWTRKVLRQFRGRGLIGTLLDGYASIRRSVYTRLLRVPGVREKVQLQLAEAKIKLEKKLVPSGPGVERHLCLPKEGWSTDKIKQELQKLADMEHTRWEDGRVSGAVYHGGHDLIALQTEAFGLFTVSNPIHPDVFPAVRKMEAELVAMVLALFNAPDGAGGVTTSGGTESILLAVYSARQKAYAERNVTEPEMCVGRVSCGKAMCLVTDDEARIIPDTAHPAFHKAGQYFNIKTHLVACKSPSYKVHVASVARYINSNTILLVGSAPNFPHGIIDDISALSRLAVKHRLPLHVDCCLGSFLVPFLDKAGFESEPFDFRIPGVTTISCDTHKYGFAPKGSSTLLYRTTDLRTYQYFIAPDWSGGVYASPSMAGSRPGALIAGAWASLISQGENGYIDACHKIVGTAKKIEAAIRDDTQLSLDLYVIGRPLVSVVAFASPTIDIYAVADGMSAKGWHLNALQNPPAIHVAVTLPIVNAWEDIIVDLKLVLEHVNQETRAAFAAGKSTKGLSGGNATALYGVAGSLPTKTIVVDLAKTFLDTLYKA